MGSSRTSAVTAIVVVVGGAGSGGRLVMEDGACQVVKLCVCVSKEDLLCGLSLGSLRFVFN